MLGGARFICKPGDSLSKVLVSRHGVRHCSVSNQDRESVVIPPRIERGPTDILKALSSTVGMDTTAFHYKYIDDPNLYPIGEIKKKIYSLSLESGKKSARWIFKNNPGFFKKQLSDPPIKKFLAIPVTNAETNPTEETLMRLIEERNVIKAMEVYQALEQQNCKVSEDTKQSLLELTCFFNCEEPPNEGVEEKWFADEREGKKKITVWLHQGFAERLFEKMDRNCPLANSAIIQGMLKHDEYPKARAIFEEARMKNIKLSVGVYNLLLSKLEEDSGGKDAVSTVTKMLEDMSAVKIKPNVGTLNAILKSFLTHGFNTKVSFALELIKEFEKLGVKPSLGSYGYLLQLLSYSPTIRRTYHDLTFEIMTHIENKQFEIVHASDFEFFKVASTAFGYYQGNAELCLRLLDMFLRNNNRRFIINAYDEKAFLMEILPVIFKKEPVEVMMDIYRRLFFTTCDVPMKMFTLVFSQINYKKGSQYLPEIWKSLEDFFFNRNLIILRNFINLVNSFSDESSLNVFHQASLNYLSLRDTPQFDSFGNHLDAFSNMAIIFVKKDDENNLSRLLKLLKEKFDSFEFLNANSVQLIFDYAVSKENVSLAVTFLEFAEKTNHPELSKMAEKCLPLLGDESKAWATELMNKGKEEKKSDTSK